MVKFCILDFYRLSDSGCPDFMDRLWMLYSTMFLGLGTYFNLLVRIGAMESCGTRERLVFSWHL